MTVGEDQNDDAGESWLEAHHSRWSSDDALLRRIVTTAGFTPTAFERLVIGQANEVYVVSTEEADELVLRLAHRPDPRVLTEASAIEAVRRRGVPAPEVLAVELLESDDNEGPTGFILERRFPGVMLAEVLRHDPAGSTSLLEALGELLAVIHEVPVNGFGNLTPDLTGSHATCGGWFVDLFIEKQLPDTLSAVSDDPASTALVNRFVELMTAHRPALDSAPGRLAHGDLSPTNVLVDDGSISGIVDWEAVKGAPQANDFAWWTTVSEIGPQTAGAVLAGYRRLLLVDENFEITLRLSQLRILTSLLGYAQAVGNTELFGRARDGVARHLRAPIFED